MKHLKSVLLVLFVQGLVVFGAIDPLSDLTESEINQSRSILESSKRFSSDMRIAILSRVEPPKAESSAAPKRRAFAAVFEKAKNKFSDVKIDLETSQIESVTELAQSQPPCLSEEYDRLDTLVKADPAWQAAMKKRGFVDFEKLYVDGWAPGPLSKKETKAAVRLMRGLTYIKTLGPMYYTRPVEGVVATVDMNHDKVVSVNDSGAVPVAPFRLPSSEKEEPKRNPLQPLIISQPEGSSIKIKDQHVEWDNWSFNFSFQQMEGLVLYKVHYNDGDKKRSILYKMNLSEMMVPYGDADSNWSFRNAMDVGEYGLGRAAHSLEAPLDVPEYASFVDAIFADDFGKPARVSHAIALYERDGGLLWKHMDQSTRAVKGRRGRELVATFATTIGNYDYGINYIFKQDASIEVEVFLTGMLLAKGTTIQTNPCTSECKHLVEPGILAPTHQHFFAFRMDFDIDGVANTPVEVDAVPLPAGSANPFGNAFDSLMSVITNEKMGGRNLDLKRSRKWKVINSKSKNLVGHPVGYTLVPGENALTYLAPSAPARKRASFLDFPVWFTRYHDEEQAAGGNYPNQANHPDGLKTFTSNNESLEDQDVVLWYVMGITHLPRPEDWPLMPVHRAGFKLLPTNFFSKNPSM